MSLVPYNKPPLTYQQQLQQLIDRGLIVDNPKKAIHLLESISYYRLSGYWYPLLNDKSNHVFKIDSNFDSAFNLYCFDRELRILILRELEKIEVSIRAKMIYVLSHQYGAFWYQDKTLFKNEYAFNKTLTSLKEECNRSDEEFIIAFKDKYSDNLPPSWMLLEMTSFGTLSTLFSNLRACKSKRIIANHFGLSDVVFASWLHSIVYIRNVCAHHSRLWNRVMRIQPIIPTSTHKQWLNNSNIPNNKSYYVLSMIAYFLHTINPTNTFSTRFKDLLKKYPNVDVKAMGFPNNWENETLWK